MLSLDPWGKGSPADRKGGKVNALQTRRTTICLAALFFAVVGLLGPSQARAQDAAATAAVKARYEKLLAAYSRIMMQPSKTSPSAIAFSIKNNMVSKGLKALLVKDEACAQKSGGVCKLDFDFLLNGQDFCKPLAIVAVLPKGKTYVLRVSNRFEACDPQGHDEPYDFTLIDESGTWVIDDAAYATKDDAGKSIRVTLKDILRGKK